ncbi:MAG: UDP-N-acetylmuramoyl-L-alanine--D-glutamate ligase [Gammaproteobacteria bacterium]|nr:UDP-N-acetylmuramoyl-L-alanine--D-glutamate ligase [Gammaproteobacteria bacterium]
MTGLQSNVLVVGLGATGFSGVRYLRRRGHTVNVVDSRVDPPNLDRLRREFPEVGLHTGNFLTSWFGSADLVLVSPGVPTAEPAIQRAMHSGIEVVGDVELFARQVNTPVLAVTGSNGKSTVAALVGEMCRAGKLAVEVAGNIGVPVLDLLSDATVVPDVYVLELSSFQLETTSSLAPVAATVLNVTRDHMDRYAQVGDYVAAKARIYHGHGRCVVNRDDPLTRDLVPASRKPVFFGSGRPARDGDFGLMRDGDGIWLMRGERKLMASTALALRGTHNLQNVLAAMALAEAVAVPRAAMIDAAERFAGLPHRSELVADRGGVKWINDSKATNVGAAVAALNGADAPVVLIAGGRGKGADFSELRHALDNTARAAVVYGEDADILEHALRGTVPIHRVADLQEAVARAATLAVAGDAVLLAPACASFDMFRNFEHRGEEFRRLVKEHLE